MTDIILAILILVVLVGGYFLPSIVGWHKKNRNAIFVLNLLMGWTFLGWLIALIWALTKD